MYQDSQHASKSLAAHPYNHPFAAKYMLFCLPGLRHLDDFIMTRPPLSVYRDFSIETTLSRQDNFWLSIGTLLPWQIYNDTKTLFPSILTLKNTNKWFLQVNLNKLPITRQLLPIYQEWQKPLNDSWLLNTRFSLPTQDFDVIIIL
jgi:hypothetical protein